MNVLRIITIGLLLLMLITHASAGIDITNQEDYETYKAERDGINQTSTPVSTPVIEDTEVIEDVEKLSMGGFLLSVISIAGVVFIVKRWNSK